MSWAIRPAMAADAAELSELAERTFRDTFSDLNSPEDMDVHCRGSYSATIQAGEIANPELRTFVAVAQRRLVGFAQLHLRPESPECVAVAPAVELRRIYVDRRFHGAGLARDLMADVLRSATSHGAKALWLGVWEKNPRGIRFYRRLGFAEVGDHVFTLGTDPQRDLVMVLHLGG